jgi:hypothetical protein
MVHRVHSASLVAMAVMVLLATGAGTAHSEQLTYADAASDVHLLTDNTATLYGDMVNADVVSVFVDHRNRRLKAKFTYTDLARTGVGFVSMLAVRTADSNRFRITVNAGGGRWSGHTTLETWNGKELECESMRHSIDYDANTVKVSMGTDCLEKPRWVKVGLVAASSPDGDAVYVDDAQRPGYPPYDTWSNKVRRG